MIKLGSNVVRHCRTFVHRINTNDGRMCVLEDVGNRDAEKTVVFLPGALGSLQTDFAPQFADGSPFQKYRLICFEPAGYGQSRPPKRTWPTANFLQRDAADVGYCLQNIGIESYSLVGWSDGGITALCLAAMEEHTENVEKIILWGSNATLPEEDRKMYLSMRDVSAWSPRMRAGYEAVYGDEFPTLWAAWIDGFIEYIDHRGGDVCLTETKRVRQPTMVIHGDKDPMVEQILAQEIVDVLKSNNVPVQYRNISDGKHNLHFKYAEQFANWSIDFIDN